MKQGRYLVSLGAIVASATLLTPTLSIADQTKVGIALFGGFQTYSMGDVNTDIRDTNSAFGTSLGEVSSGAGFGGGLRLRTSSDVVFSLDYLRLAGSTSDSGDDGTVVYVLDYQLPANAIVGGVTYLFPAASKTRFGLNGGIGYYMSDANLELSASDGTTTVSVTGDATGSGVGFHAAGVIDATLSRTVHLGGSLGYRYAKTGDVEVGGTKFPGYGIDWSGLMTQAGLTFYFGSE